MRLFIILDKQKVSDFLLLGFKSLGLNQKTIFRNIKTLRPGSTITINFDKKLAMKIRRFFSAKFRLTFKHSYNEAVGILREKILNVFATRFRSDVP